MTFRLARYISGMTATSDGLYVGTSVIKRFTRAPDQLLRIDPSTLRVAARAEFPGSVGTVTAAGGDVWAALGDGRVVRLDPSTLTVRVARRLLPPLAGIASGSLTSQPALGAGALWAVSGNELDLELVRMDPRSLQILGHTRIPTAGPLYQALNNVIADDQRVYVTGSAIQELDRNGSPIGPPVLPPGLESTAVGAGGLVGLTNSGAGGSLVLMDHAGTVVARTAFADIGGDVAISGDDVWFLGNAGAGDGIVHVRLSHTGISAP